MEHSGYRGRVIEDASGHLIIFVVDYEKYFTSKRGKNVRQSEVENLYPSTPSSKKPDTR